MRTLSREKSQPAGVLEAGLENDLEVGPVGYCSSQLNATGKEFLKVKVMVVPSVETRVVVPAGRRPS